MKRYFEFTLFVVVLSAITVCSKTISIEIIEVYNNCIEFMASNTLGTGYFKF